MSIMTTPHGGFKTSGDTRPAKVRPRAASALSSSEVAELPDDGLLSAGGTIEPRRLNET